jgi:uncharacterized protein
MNNAPITPSRPFWETKTLAQMSPQEWESLCDGCGRCCFVKLEDEDTQDVYFTSIACHLLDQGTCRCSDYPNRLAQVPDCMKLTPSLVYTTSWLPITCAYRRVAEGRGLADWHPLISGNKESVHTAGISVRGRITATEGKIDESDAIDHIIDWPMREEERECGEQR